MATFKDGQRVRGVATLRPEHMPLCGDKRGRLGMLGTVVHIPGVRCIADYFVVWDDLKSKFTQGAYAMYAYQLAPLDDPKADAFIEGLKKLAREPQPAHEPPVRAPRVRDFGRGPFVMRAMERGAVLSDCGKFRYRLSRRWEVGYLMPFVMLNPSTADASQDDPTIRKCIGFAERHGYAGIEVVNLYAYRATQPADLKSAGYQRGPENDRHIEDALRESCSGSVYCAWGANARGMSRPAEVMAIIRKLALLPMALKLTADGIPCHPLMLPYDCEPVLIGTHSGGTHK
jgi:hypothetical protein